MHGPQGFDELLCESQLIGVEPLWHQIETVRKVLWRFHGRVLREIAQALVDEAHQTCAYSKAMRGNIDVVITLV